MKTFALRLFLLLAISEVAPRDLFAQAVGGAATLRIKGASDNRIALPYQRPPTDAGQVSAVGPGTVKLLDKNWAADQFVYAAGQQTRTYYAQFADGSLAGSFYKVIGNNADTLVVDTEGDNLASHSLGQIAYGDTVKIIPYWTVADVFGATAAELILEPRTSPVFAKDDILLYNDSQIGLNKPPTRTLYFRLGAGWRSVADPNTSSADTVLPPGGVFIVRRRHAADVALVNSGLYYKQRRVLFVHGGNGTTGNDQQIALTFPEPVTLNESNLASNVVRPSTSPVLRNDEVFFWRNAAPGYNLPANTTVYFRQGSGWERVGDTTPIGDTFTIEPGEGIIIRKKAANAGIDWLQLPPQ